MWLAPLLQQGLKASVFSEGDPLAIQCGLFIG
jgi:hypothetical protein